MRRRARGLTRAERTAHYRRLLAEFEANGQSLQKFAASKGVAYTTLAYWKSRLARLPTAPAFQEVVVPAAPAAAFELELGAGRRLRIPSGFDAGELARLLQALGRGC